MTKVHFETKHRQWVIQRLKLIGLFSGKTLQRVATVCSRAGLQTETDEGAMTQIVEVLDEKQVGSPNGRQALASELYESVVRQPREQVRTIWSDYQSKRSGNQEETGTKSRESTLLPWLFYILQDYESYNSSLLNSATPVKLFLLTPLVGFTNPMMPVSIKFWKYMAGKVGTEEWSDLFRFSRHLRTRPSLRMVTATWTDGVSISFVRDTITSSTTISSDSDSETPDPMCGTSYVSSKDADNLSTFKRVVTIDPGRRSPFMALSFDNPFYQNQVGLMNKLDHGLLHPTKDTIMKVGVSKKEWSELRHFRRSQLDRERWITHQDSVRTIQVNIPSPKTSSLVQLQTHTSYVRQHLNALRGFYGTRRHARQRLDLYMAQQTAYNKVLNKLLNKHTLEQTLFIVGDGRFDHASSGHSATPSGRRLVQELKKRGAEVRWIDEFRTSKNCSKCHHPVSPFKQSQKSAVDEVVRLLTKGHRPTTREYQKNGGPELPSGSLIEGSEVLARCKNNIRRVQQPWGVRVCTNCRTAHCRDTNACRNMFYLFLHIVKGDGVTKAYSRNRSNASIQHSTPASNNNQQTEHHSVPGYLEVAHRGVSVPVPASPGGTL